jgi:hypothetical protein
VFIQTGTEIAWQAKAFSRLLGQRARMGGLVDRWYHRWGTHLSLGVDSPESRSVEFFEYTRTMPSYRSVIADSTTLVQQRHLRLHFCSGGFLRMFAALTSACCP